MDILTEDEFMQLRALAERIRDNASQFDEVGYGYFPGGDPRDFCPDPEACNAEELANHKHACELMETGKVTHVDGMHHFPLLGADGAPIGHVTHARYGVGTYTIRDTESHELSQQLDEWIDRVRRLEEMSRR